jgi:hypothetical protein
VLSTADLEATTGKQVAARLAAEAGGGPGAGPAVDPSLLRLTVADLMQRRRRGGARGEAAAGRPGGLGGGGGDLLADDKALLRATGCERPAFGVFTQLVSWLQEQGQEQQQQQQQGSEQEGSEEEQEQQQEGSGEQRRRRQQPAQGPVSDDLLLQAAGVASGTALPLLRGLRAGGGAAAALAGANAVEGPEAVADPRLALVRGRAWSACLQSRGLPWALANAWAAAGQNLVCLPSLVPATPTG